MYEMELELKASGLVVTTLRAPMLYDGPVTGKYDIIEDETYRNGIKISRADIAHFLINELSQNHWINRTLAIADPIG